MLSTDALVLTTMKSIVKCEKLLEPHSVKDKSSNTNCICDTRFTWGSQIYVAQRRVKLINGEIVNPFGTRPSRVQ